MSEFRCPYYYWDGSQWRCIKTSDYLSVYDFDTYCTDKERCQKCTYFNK